MHREINHPHARKEKEKRTVMQKILCIWPGLPTSGTLLVSWPADISALGTSKRNSSKYQGKRIKEKKKKKKLSLRWLLK